LKPAGAANHRQAFKAKLLRTKTIANLRVAATPGMEERAAVFR